MLIAHEILLHGPLKESQEGVIITVGIKDHDRVGEQAELFPGDDLEQLLEGATTTGQGNNGVGQVSHPLLALVHRLGDD